MNQERVIELKKVSKAFFTRGLGESSHRQAVLTDVTLSLSPGETYGFVGLNGAGKTTTIKSMMGLIKPDSGSVRIFGQEPDSACFQKIGFAPEKPGFYESLSGKETIDFSARLLNVDVSSPRKNEMLERVGLFQDRDKRVGAYSKGMQQRLGIACAMLHDPDLYILDEPGSGLDPLGRRLIKDILGDLKRAGKTVFFSTHIIGDLVDLCDKIALIHRGKIMFEGTLGSFNPKGLDLEERFVELIQNECV